MGKWYKQGYKDAKENFPFDPPFEPGHLAYAQYEEGYEDRRKEMELYGEEEQKTDQEGI
jgi:hypothetical protein